MTMHPTLHPVHLVGAGPGDPELLTLKAVRILRAASVILVDDLVGEQVLASALEGCVAVPRVIHVGKRGGCASTPQDFIEKLMVREALAGEKVVRLKGGDPLIFGRAGEEIEALHRAGLTVEVVNGITAGLGAAAALGVGWTDRRVAAQATLLVTGHAQPGSPGPDWDAIAAVAAHGVTLVIYMGVSHIDRIVGRLLATLPASLPAAIVQHASTRDERRLVSTLGQLVQDVATNGFGSPAILIVGQVLVDADASMSRPLARLEAGQR
ncbi:MAG: uroporphyrinogen-III C-methyltransferase [Vitreoscilla sp.]